MCKQARAEEGGSACRRADLARRLEQQLRRAVVGGGELRQADGHAVVAVGVRSVQDFVQLLQKQGRQAASGAGLRVGQCAPQTSRLSRITWACACKSHGTKTAASCSAEPISSVAAHISTPGELVWYGSKERQQARWLSKSLSASAAAAACRPAVPSCTAV